MRIGALKKYVGKVFTLLLVLYPPLSVYFADFNFTKLSFSDIFLLILLPILIIELFWIKLIKIETDILFLLIWCIFHFLVVSVLILNNGLEVFQDECHFMLLLFVLAVLYPNIFDCDLGIKALTAVCVISSCFLILQFVLLHLFGIYLPGQLPFFETSTAWTGHIRPFSLFSEPAAFGIYNSIGLAVILLKEEFRSKYALVCAGIITLALIISTSTTSLGLMLIVYLYWIGADIKKRIKYLLIFVITLFPVIIILEIKYSIFLTIYEHSFAGLFSGNYAWGLVNRLGSLNIAIKYHSSDGILIGFLGSGMVSLNEFFPTIGRMNIYYGLSGYIVFAMFFIKKYIQVNRMGRALLAIAIVVAIFAESVFGIAMLWYMPYLLIDQDKQERIYAK